MPWRRLGATWAFALLVACGSTRAPDGASGGWAWPPGDNDGGIPGADASTDDGGPDAAVDAGDAAVDGGGDAGDADTGTPFDGGDDASDGEDGGDGRDAGIDAGADGGDAGDASIPNRPPTISVGSQYTVEIGQSLGFVVQASDPDGDQVSISPELPLPDGATFYSASRFFFYQPRRGGDVIVTFVASDGHLETRRAVRLTTPGPDASIDFDASTDASVDASIDAGIDAGRDAGPQNRPPVFILDDRYTAEMGQSFALYVLAGDPDGDPITVSVVPPLPSGATFDVAQRVLRYSPPAPGDVTVKFIASDGELEGWKTIHLYTPPDTTAPVPPTLTATAPTSPSLERSPKVLGVAEAGSTVRIYTTSNCSGLPVATGTAAAFLSPGLAIAPPVAEGSTMTFRATATDSANNTSSCSTSSITYFQPPFQSPNRVSSRANHTCAITADGGVKCWGAGYSYQLGNGSWGSQATAVEARVGGSVTSVSTGENFSCALKTDAGVVCWGEGWSGQLGNGSSLTLSTPVGVTGLGSRVRVISSGDYHSCAVLGDGEIRCWGRNSSGQLGDGTSSTSYTPVSVTGIGEPVIGVGTGSNHTCAATVSGAVKCWGLNSFGQLGTGTTINSGTPVAAVGLAWSAAAVSAGLDTTCAMSTDGGVACWGHNNNGQLGEGSTADRTTPVDVVGLSKGVVHVVAGYSHSCAVTSTGDAKCWGQGYRGEIGDGTTTWARLSPATVLNLPSAAVAIAAGRNHTCATTANDGVQCWGGFDNGELGNGRLSQATLAAQVAAVPAATTIGVGDGHSCSANLSGGITCWGAGDDGKLGNSKVTANQRPSGVVGITENVTSVAGGQLHTCAVLAGGSAKCWGANWGGQLGIGVYRWEPTTVPDQVAGLTSGVTQVATGYYHSCAVTALGNLMCWGAGFNGQIGDGTIQSRYSPVDVVGLPAGASVVATSYSHSCAVAGLGSAYCWGSNMFGQIGDGTTFARLTATAVPSLQSGIRAVSTGFYHSCALSTLGAMKCWGYNSSGQLGDGSQTPRFTPVDVVGLSSGVTMISAGNSFSCALLATGTVKCWGLAYQGQTGDYVGGTRSTPVSVVGVSNAAMIESGSDHTCAIDAVGSVSCWGYDRVGQVTGVFPGYPTRVIGF